MTHASPQACSILNFGYAHPLRLAAAMNFSVRLAVLRGASVRPGLTLVVIRYYCTTMVATTMLPCVSVSMRSQAPCPTCICFGCVALCRAALCLSVLVCPCVDAVECFNSPCLSHVGRHLQRSHLHAATPSAQHCCVELFIAGNEHQQAEVVTKQFELFYANGDCETSQNVTPTSRPSKRRP